MAGGDGHGGRQVARCRSGGALPQRLRELRALGGWALAVGGWGLEERRPGRRRPAGRKPAAGDSRDAAASAGEGEWGGERDQTACLGHDFWAVSVCVAKWAGSGDGRWTAEGFWAKRKIGT